MDKATKNILFLCVENSCRSQIAEGLAKHFSKGNINVFSAGSRPVTKVSDSAVEVMREIGIDISSAVPKGFKEIETTRFDYVITLGCKDTCPFYPSDKYIEWDVEDPKGKDIVFFRKTRDQIKDKVLNLIREIGSEHNKGVD